MSLSKVQFEKEVDASLRKFADDLKADEDYHAEGIRLCESVRKALEQATQNEEFSIASTHYGGSVGKKTDVQQPDFDIVMKINIRSPPFKDVLEFFKLYLQQQADRLKIRDQSIRLTKYSIQFTFTNGMDVDLLPAVAQMTQEEVLKKMKRSGKNRHYYSSSLVDQQVEFMKHQNAFAHAVVRLSKFWYKKMEITDYISGGSTIFECLAVAAVIEEGNNQESMYSAFMRVAENVKNLDKLKLAFEILGDSWRIRGPVHGQKIPYLLEPANSTNNLLLDMDPSVKKILKSNGHSMRDRLRNLMDIPNYCTSVTDSGIEVNFKKLFKRRRKRNHRRKQKLKKFKCELYVAN